MPQRFQTLLFAFIVGGGLLPSTALAWSSLGHQTIAAIAYNYMNDDTRAAVDKMLKGQTIEKASAWPDAIKDVDDWRHSKYYHYKNIPKGVDYFTDLKNLPEKYKVRSDIVRALLHAEDVIVGPGFSSVDKKNALRFFLHLIGDLHQPLHVGYISDVGGNLVKMNWNGVKTNLHAVWDRYLLLEYGKKKLLPTEYYSPQDMAKTFKPATAVTLANWRAGDYVDWFNESVIFRDEAYLDIQATYDSYYKTHAKTMELQIHRGGYRLAMLLEGLLGKNPSTSKSNLQLRMEILDIIGVNQTDFNTDMELTSISAFRFYENHDDDHAEFDDCGDH